MFYGQKVKEWCHDCGTQWVIYPLQGSQKDLRPDYQGQVYASCPHGHRAGHRSVELVVHQGHEGVPS